MNSCSYLARVFQLSNALFLAFFSLIVLGKHTCSAQNNASNTNLDGEWYISLHTKAIGSANFLMNFEVKENTFTALSRKNADKNILGYKTAVLGRLFTQNFKKGSLLRIENGNFERSNNTLHIKGELISTLGKFKVNGTVENDQLQSVLTNSMGQEIGWMQGNRNIPNSPLNNYKRLLNEVFLTTEKNIYNRAILKNKAWRRFKSKMNSSVTKFEDDLDMIFSFYYHSRELPFSHFTLSKTLDSSQKLTHKDLKNGYLTLKQKNDDLAYLKISSFSGSSSEVDSTFKIINERKYDHLIIDLRNNSGGNVEAGITFAANVLDTISYGGVFLTQKWFNNHSELPQIRDYDKFAQFSEANNDLLLDGIHKTKGLYLKIIPNEKTYKGELYVLVNKNTASTSEPIVYELKKQQRALIIGEATAGAMLSSETFYLGDYKITIPTADYYTSDGYKIDQNGVKPNLKTNSEDALQKTIEIITNLENN
jgi:hypothetical protein